MKILTNEEEASFRKHWKSLKKDVLIDKLWEMLQIIELQNIENEELRTRVGQEHAQYLSACRSVGGVTLPPGV